MRTWFTLICLALSTAFGAAPASGFQDLGNNVHNFGRLGANGAAVRDVDVDGVTDLILHAQGPADLVMVYGRTTASADITLKQTLVYGYDSVRAVMAMPGDEATRIVLVLADGRLQRLGGWPLGEIGSFAIESGARAARIADIDADGALELLVLTSSSLDAYSLNDGQLEWSDARVAIDIEVAQLDADAALEIITSKGDWTPGEVLDGVTRQVQWSYANGFGRYLAAGRLGLNGTSQFVGVREWNSFAIYGGTPLAQLWQVNVNDSDAVTVADLDGDNRDEILVGDGQWGDLHVYDSVTRQERFLIETEGYGTARIAVLDIDGDQVQDIFVSPGAAATDNGFNGAIVDAQTREIKKTFTSFAQGASATAMGDLTGDGDIELVVGTSATYGYALLHVVDATSGSKIWQAPFGWSPSADDPFQMKYRSAHIAQIDLDPAMEIVVVGEANSGGRILVIDGATFAVELQIGSALIDPLPSRYLMDSRLIQYDGDGVPDLLVATAPLSTGVSGAELEVVSLTSGASLWTSAAIGSSFQAIEGVVVAQTDGDAADEFIAVLPQELRAFDSRTGAQEWVLAVNSQGAIYIAQGLDGPELAVFQNSGAVFFYSATTRQFLRSVLLDSPLEKIASLDGTARQLLAIGGERLQLVDGADGAVLSVSATPIGSAPPIKGAHLSFVRRNGDWWIASGRSFATYRHLLADLNIVFMDGFE
jgi:hypothetical protein